MISSNIERIQFFLLLISFPLYCLYLLTIIRFRNKQPFNSDFFKLCFNLGIADLLNLIHNWTFYKFPHFGWFSSVINYPILAKIAVMGAWNFAFVQHFGVLSLAVNRFTGIVTPLRHQLIWTNRVISLVILLCWLIPFLFVIPQSRLEYAYAIDNITGQLSKPMWLNQQAEKTYFTIGAIINASINITTLSLYISMFCYARIKSTNQDAAANHLEITLAIYGFSTFVVMFMIGVYAGVRAATPIGDQDTVQTLILLYGVFSDVFSWCNPWLSLVLLRKVRNHMFATLLCKNVPATIIIVKVAPINVNPNV